MNTAALATAGAAANSPVAGNRIAHVRALDFFYKYAIDKAQCERYDGLFPTAVPPADGQQARTRQCGERVRGQQTAETKSEGKNIQ